MGLVLTLEAPGSVGFLHNPARSLGSREVPLRAPFSGISAGTELMTYCDTNPYLHKGWDGVAPVCGWRGVLHLPTASFDLRRDRLDRRAPQAKTPSLTTLAEVFDTPAAYSRASSRFG